MQTIKQTIAVLMIAAMLAFGAFAGDDTSALDPAASKMGELADLATSPRQTLLGSIEPLKAARNGAPNQHLQEISDRFQAAIDDCDRMLAAESVDSHTEEPASSLESQNDQLAMDAVEASTDVGTKAALVDNAAVDFQPPILLDVDPSGTADAARAERLARLRGEINALLGAAISDIDHN